VKYFFGRGWTGFADLPDGRKCMADIEIFRHTEMARAVPRAIGLLQSQSWSSLTYPGTALEKMPATKMRR
jgi:hypothetical protein